MLHFDIMRHFDTISNPVADPGFPVWGGPNLLHGCFLVETYAKRKELDPFGRGGGKRWRRPHPWTRHCSCVFSSFQYVYPTLLSTLAQKLGKIVEQVFVGKIRMNNLTFLEIRQLKQIHQIKQTKIHLNDKW